MARKFVSPGVFTHEEDASFLAQGVAGIGAAIVGRTEKGPAYVPTMVDGLSSFADTFGAPSPDYPLSYGAKNYLRNSTSMTVIRTLGHDDGTSVTNGYVIQAGNQGIVDAANGQVLAVIHHTGSTEAMTVTGVANDADNFIVQLTGSSGAILFAATASFITTAANYVEKVLNTDPVKYSTYGHYLYRLFKDTTPAASASWGITEISGSTVDFQKNFAGGSTPWIKSQPVGGIEHNLFRFHTLTHGKATNNDIKVMIANVKASPSPLATSYGNFDVVIRQFDDTDQRMKILESFSGCSLDPNSQNYLLRVIGDHYEEFDTTQRKFVGYGNFQNKSKHVRIELDLTANPPQEALPWGHRGYTKEQFSGSEGIPSVPDMKLTPNQFDRAGNLDSNITWGISFVSGGIEDRMKAFPVNALTTTESEFTLANLSASYYNGKQMYNYNSSATTEHQPIYSSASLYKFNLPFQGGFDGFDLRVEDPLYLSNSADDTDIGVVSLKRAIDTVADPDAFDMNLLAIPGIHNIKVTDRARIMCNDRNDVMYIMDVTGSSVSEVISYLSARDIDDNYTAVYYPDVKIDDKTNSKVVRVAPSVAALGTLSFNDRVAQPWSAPAGMNRGGLQQFDVIDVIDRLTFSDRNDLYDNRINPITVFKGEGAVVFGQKTLQVKASALDRINVRRLLIFAKKTIASAARFLLFEPNNSSTWQRFLNTVNPILDNVRQNQGVERFRVVMDASTNTADTIDRNIMSGKIFLQPTKAAEFIDLSFIITNAGVSFGE